MYKTKLQELCHQNRWGLPRYSSMKDGPDHTPLFKASVSLNALCFHSSVSCKSSKDAQNQAAMRAFLHFTSPPPLPSSSTEDPLPLPQTSQSNDLLPLTPNNSGDFMTSAEPELATGGPEIRETSQGPEIHSKAPDVQCRYKSQLQNYARWKKINSPTYTSTREGPAHAPCFKATVTVDGSTFARPDFFKSRKEAEHAAAIVALMSLPFDAFQEDECGFYKSLLQELTQREDLSKPVYKTIKSGEPHMPTFSSTVEVEGELFYGKTGRTKKEAEIKAAKVAYTCLIERGQNRSIGFTSRIVEADGDVKPTLSSELVVTANSQNLEQNCQLVSFPDIKHAEDGKAEIVSADAKTNFDDYCLSPVMTGNQGASLSSPPMTHADCSAPSISDSSVGRAAGTRSYLLCNRVRVYPVVPDISFPKGITVLQISENRWVAVSLEFPNDS
ncbi:hypothetical protein Dsin_019564 [Dipteronia sinensis]|uniref:DRBM domain-containing protein n=1 Tax=Dipteronia sinensis TaxID=43782 RepID=A0AAE0A8V7_9ROSI|nr:hypothetical protein Dsin_019564 [Dipteronia sinensis]